MLSKIIKGIHYLRWYFLVFSTIGLFYYAGLNPIDIGQFLGAKMGSAVGMSMSVPENPLNRLALELKEKEETLDLRENQLKQREDDLNAQKMDAQMKLIIVLSIGVAALFILILINYYLDYKRRKNNFTLPAKK